MYKVSGISYERPKARWSLDREMVVIRMGKEKKKIALTVIYDGTVDRKVDRAIEKALKPLGFRRWASGFNLLTKKRDLAFEEEEEPKPRRKRLETVTRVIDGDTGKKCLPKKIGGKVPGRGVVKKIRTIKIGPKKYAHARVMSKKGPRGGRTLIGSVHTKKEESSGQRYIAQRKEQKNRRAG